MEDKLLKKMIKYNLEPDFPNEGVLFIDFMPTFMDLGLMNSLAENAIKTIDLSNIDYVIMPESRGYIFGTIVANKLGVDLLPVRKHGKLPERYVKMSYTYDTEYSQATLDLPIVDLEGKRCLFVDDVFATGGTYKACVQMVEHCGGTVIGGLCLYDVGINPDERVYCFLNSEDITKEA